MTKPKKIPKAILIRIEFDNGALLTVKGDEATQIWNWYDHGQRQLVTAQRRIEELEAELEVLS